MTGTIPPFAVRVSRERKRLGALPADGTSGRTAAAAEAEPGALHNGIVPALPLGLPFVRTAVSADSLDWAETHELFQNFQIETVETRYSANAKATRRVGKMLISNFNAPRKVDQCSIRFP